MSSDPYDAYPHQIEWKMDFEVIKATASKILDAHGLHGRYTVGASSEMAKNKYEPRLLGADFTFEDGKIIKLLQPYVRWLRNGPLDGNGKITTPFGETEFNRFTIDDVFQTALGEFVRLASPQQHVATQPRTAEGMRAIANSVAEEDRAVYDLIVRLRTRGGAIAQAYGVTHGVDESLFETLDSRIRISAAWQA